MIELTGMSGRFPLIECHFFPPSVVLKTWPGRWGVVGLKPAYDDVGGPVVGAVDRDLGDRPRGQVAEVEPRPGRVVARLSIGAQEDATVVGAGVDGVTAADADRRDEAAARPVRRDAETACGEIRG